MWYSIYVSGSEIRGPAGQRYPPYCDRQDEVKMMNYTLGATVVLAVVALVGGIVLFAACTEADADSATTTAADAQVNLAAATAAEGAARTGSVGDPYPLTTCPVSGEKLGGMGDPVVYDHNGREIRFCCSGCIKDFKADPDKYIKPIDAEIVAQQKPNYPMETCVVSGEKLGGMGKVIDYVYNNRLVELCCGGCIGKLKQDPASYIGKLDAAVVEAQVKDYPLDTCVVTGEKLGGMGDPVDYVFGDRLVRFCCAGCIKDFKADPAKYIAKLD